MSKPITILSIDGGGIRGIIPAMVLSEIERRTEHRIAGLFDLIAGTSTGGILALGLTKPDASGGPQYTAQEAIALYDKEGTRVFSRSALHQIQTAGSAIGAKFPSEGVEAVLEEYFGDARLGDACTNVMITGYEIERRFPFFFKSKKARDPDQQGYNFLMKKAARATSAAPTYFEPLRLEAEPDDPSANYYALVGGGVYANNPAMCAYVEAKKMFPDSNNFLIVSLGTGELTRPLPYSQAKNWGLVQWAVPVLDVVFDGVSDTVDYQLRHLLPEKNYYRFQVRLSEGNDDLDDTSPINIRDLKLIAEDLIRTNDKALDALCDQLVKAKRAAAKPALARRQAKSAVAKLVKARHAVAKLTTAKRAAAKPAQASRKTRRILTPARAKRVAAKPRRASRRSKRTK